jgi:hypothetical protein
LDNKYENIDVGEISGSHSGEYKDESLMRYRAM